MKSHLTGKLTLRLLQLNERPRKLKNCFLPRKLRLSVRKFNQLPKRKVILSSTWIM